MTEVVLETRDLTKRYGDFVAVDRLNLQVHVGEVFGLLGPNGAGKTTTILMTLGLTEPTSGSVRVLGFDPVREPLSVKARVGYLPDQIGFYDDLTARENLSYVAKLNGLSRREAEQRIDAALAQVGLSDVKGKRVATFSRGMRQRLGVADVLIKRPQVIIMDEPTLGLDPEAARDFLQLIARLKSEGITILLSSHLLHQVQAVCDRVGLFHRGQMMLKGTVSELAQRVLGGAYRVYVQTEGSHQVEDALRQVPGIVAVTRSGQQTFEVEAQRDIRGEAAQAVVQSGGKLLALHSDVPSLDEVYTRFFQREVSYGSGA